MDRRDISGQFLGDLAALYNLSGSSQTRISQALREQKAFGSEHETLRMLVEDIDSYCKSVEPIPVAFKKAVVIKGLLDEFRSKEEPSLIYPAYVVEFVDDRTLFQGMQEGKCRRTSINSDAAPIRDKQTAEAAVTLLETMGHFCRSTFVRVRTTESRLAKALADLGFTQETA